MRVKQDLRSSLDALVSVRVDGNPSESNLIAGILVLEMPRLASWRDWVDDEKRKGTSFVAIQISLSCWSTISPLVSHPNIKSSLSNIIWARGLISSWSTVSQVSGQKKLKNLTWNWDGIRTSCRGDRVENHATNTIDTDTRSTILDDRVVGIGGTANGDPIGSASIANHTASCWGSAGDTERHRGCIDC